MVFGLVIRAGIVAGAVYYTRKWGVWGNSEQSEKLYNGIKSELRPHVQSLEKKLPFEVPALPQTGEVRYLAKHYYNQGVKNTFHFIEMLPCYAGQLAKKAADTYESFTLASPPTSSPPKKE